MTDAKPTRPARRHLRRALAAVLLVVLLGGAAHGLAWHWATGAIAVGMSDWVTQRRAEGWTIEHGPPARGGWPVAARLTMADVQVASPARAGHAGMAHQAARVVLQISPAQPDRLVVLLDGPQWLSLGGATIPFAADRFALSVPLAAGSVPAAVELDVARLETLLPAGPLALRAARIVLVRGAAPPPGAEAEAVLGLTLRAEGVVPPASPLTAAFGREVEHLSIEALLAGTPPLPGPPAVMAAAWRDAGGVVELPALALRWGPLAGDARLSLALDAALQPQGRGTLRMSGAPAALEALAGAGLIDGGAARAGQGVVALLARTPPEGGPPRVEVPVALANGSVSVARVPLMRVAPIAWPASRAR
ncbi:DUF2125 domain-containing protein [Roseomonas sp. CECT 9278]|uniref:DUF2125 domain-containing protein n=1 Tax=Roseomonas sp. CECT 9278 TaxID=2845823 RepID=UPI001E4EAC02|nr:DUF2125 domain-containing protein [Roseomonas sp. CECT 9278]CAH0143747.1 hypothetical protein ROS9278_00541 [Roseomonas sp. CECT 9278]